MMFRKLMCLTTACLLLAIAGSGKSNLLFEYWMNIPGVNVADLTSNPRYPGGPDEWELREDFLSRIDWADNFGARARGYLTAPETGEYTFWVAGDDECQLWLSTDEDPANATMIAQVTGWTPVMDWFGTVGAGGGNQQSEPIFLEAGQRYYIEGLQKEGGGGDSIAAAWAGPGIGEEPTLITGEYLSPYQRLQAFKPVPADGAIEVTDPMFEWVPGDTAVDYEIYFGTSPDLTEEDVQDAIGKPEPLWFYFDGFEPGATYYWRIDQIDADWNFIPGTVWSFTVQPLEANTPFPADSAVFVPLEIMLTWRPGQGAKSHTVYLGSELAAVAAGDESVLAGSVEQTQFLATGLEPGKTYFWRVDQVGRETIEGDVWAFSTVPVVAPVEDESLVGWWTFDEEPLDSMVVLDMSGNNRHGIIRGALRFVDVPFQSRAMRLPGGSNQFVDIGPVGISGNDPTTIAAWGRAAHKAMPHWTLLFGFTGTAEAQGGSGSHFNIGRLGGPGGVGAHIWGWEETIFTDDEALEWRHYAMTYDGTTITYYGDGVEMDTDPGKSNVRDLSIRGDRVHIGSRVTQASSFDGWVDDCRVYNRVLSAEEIAEIAYRAPTVVWVSFHEADDKPVQAAADVGFTEASDIGYTDLLTAAGYNVVRYVSTGNPDAALLNAADLVILSRAAPSGDYANDRATTWNTAISAPMMILGGYVLRQNRMGFYTGNDIQDTIGDVSLTVTDPDHPIFAGVALTDGTMDNLYAAVVPLPTDGTMSRGISIVNGPANPNGTVLATLSAASGQVQAGAVVIAEWPAGVEVTHAGGAGTDVLAGPRLVFLTGSREPGGVTGGQAAGIYDLYEDGAVMFLNAVDYMINPPPPPPPAPIPPGENLLANGGFEDGTTDGWGSYGNLTMEVVTEDAVEGDFCLFVEVGEGVANFWEAGLQPYQGTFEAGKKYTFSVFLKSKSGELQINIKPELAASPWTGFGEKMVTVTEEWQEFSVTTAVFEADVAPAGVTLHVGHAVGGFWVDGARWYEGDYAPADAENEVEE